MPNESSEPDSLRRRWFWVAIAVAALLAFLGFNAPGLLDLAKKSHRTILGHSGWPQWASVCDVGESADLGCMSYSVVAAEWRTFVDVNPARAKGDVRFVSVNENKLELPEFSHVSEGAGLARADGTLYRATEGKTVSNGELLLEIEALEGGEAGNAARGTTISLVNPVPGLSPQAVVTSSGLVGGGPGPRLDALTGEVRYLIVDVEMSNRDLKSSRRAVLPGLVDRGGEKFTADSVAMRVAVGADPYGVSIVPPGGTARSRLVFRAPHSRQLALWVGDPCDAELWAVMLLAPSFRR